MSVEDRLHRLEKRLEQVERKQDQHWESYKRLLNGILRRVQVPETDLKGNNL